MGPYHRDLSLPQPVKIRLVNARVPWQVSSPTVRWCAEKGHGGGHAPCVWDYLRLRALMLMYL
jgi:hypothetical protein